MFKWLFKERKPRITSVYELMSDISTYCPNLPDEFKWYEKERKYKDRLYKDIIMRANGGYRDMLYPFAIGADNYSQEFYEEIVGELIKFGFKLTENRLEQEDKIEIIFDIKW